MLKLVRDRAEVERRHVGGGALVVVDRAGRVRHEQIEHLRLVRSGAGRKAAAGRLWIEIPREEKSTNCIACIRWCQRVDRLREEENDAIVAADVRRRAEGRCVEREDQRVERGGDRRILRVGIASARIFVVCHDQRARADGGHACGAIVGVTARLIRIAVQRDRIADLGIGGDRECRCAAT